MTRTTYRRNKHNPSRKYDLLKILRTAGEHPDADALAKQLKCSAPTVYLYLVQLENEGLIDKQVTPTQNGKQLTIRMTLYGLDFEPPVRTHKNIVVKKTREPVIHQTRKYYGATKSPYTLMERIEMIGRRGTTLAPQE